MVDIISIETPSLGDRSYLAHDGTVALVVDPQRDIDRVLDLLAEAAGGERASTEEARVDDSRPAPSPEAVAAYRGLRIRTIGGDPAALARALRGSPDVTISSGEVTEEGRIELLTFLREQSVSLTAHRYGRLDPTLADLRL